MPAAEKEVLAQEERLSEQEMEALREQYPIYGIYKPEMIGMAEVPLEQYIEDGRYDSFVYGEIIADIETYIKEISTGHAAFDEKLKSQGFSLDEEFYGYVVEVLEDTEGRYQAGDRIVIVANQIFKEYNPDFKVGMKAVVPVAEMDDGINMESFHAIGCYYVTEEGFVLSAYDEESGLRGEKLSGIKIEELLHKLREMIGQ